MISQKKGQLTQNTIVGIILVVLGAAIIVLFIGRYTPLYGEVFDTETCRGSVAVKATIESSTIIAKGIGTTKLACRTKDVCISSGGKCPTGSKKESIANEEDIKKEIANLMYECWFQFGEGELNFAGDKTFKEQICGICSRIKFSEDAQKDFKFISDMGKYLSENHTPKDSKHNGPHHLWAGRDWFQQNNRRQALWNKDP